MFISKIITTQNKENFEAAIHELLAHLKMRKNLVKLTLFVDFKSKEDYSEKVQLVSQLVYSELGENFPKPTFVAQKPLLSELALEYVQYEGNGQVKYSNCLGNNYAIIEEGDQSMFFINGLESQANSIEDQSQDIFAQAEKILTDNEMPINAIVRQWNYIPQILGFYNEAQNYQAFNDVRTLFYNKTEWIKGYPAATGIGVVSDRLTIDIVAMKGGEVQPIINPNQIDAHVYSDEVLEKGLDLKSTPKFERAKLVSSGNDNIVFVSGTAAIIGEESRDGNSVSNQTTMTLNHIDTLLSEKCIQQEGEYKKPQIQSMRAYVKNVDDVNIVQEICKKRYLDVPVVYIQADVCRNELLIEIEAFASFSASCSH